MNLLNPKTVEEKTEFFKQCFSKFQAQIAEDMMENAHLIFDRTSDVWNSEKIIVEYHGKLHFYPSAADVGKSLAAAADTLVYEYVIWRRL